MRKLLQLQSSILALFIFSCSSYDYVIESDYSYKGNFNKYKSFAFVYNKDFGGSPHDREIIEKYLSGTLKAWGYEKKDKRSSILIFYSLYYEDMNFQGFNQPDFENWVRWNYSNDEVVFKKDTLKIRNLVGTPVDTELTMWDQVYDKVNYELQEGTILISLYDRKKHKTVWQGYASGIFGKDQFKNERIMKSAVRRIMDEYKLLAFDVRSQRGTIK